MHFVYLSPRIRTPDGANAFVNSDQYDEEDEAALADLVSKKGQQAADDAVNNVGEAKVRYSLNSSCLL